MRDVGLHFACVVGVKTISDIYVCVCVCAF
jgi:hypothetical protein